MLKLNFRVRDRKQDIVDKARVFGERGLLSRDKVFFDMTGPDTPDGVREGTEFEDVEFDDLWFEAHYGGVREIAFTGGVLTEQKGAHWVVGRHGLDKLQQSKGWTTVFFLHSGVDGRPKGGIKLRGGVVGREDLTVELSVAGD